MRVKVYRSMVARKNHIDTLYLESSELPRVGDELQLRVSSVNHHVVRVSKVIRLFDLGKMVGVKLEVIVRRKPRPSPNGDK